MKKTILMAATAFAAFFATKIYAQSSVIELGVKGGLNLSNYSGVDGNKARLGYNLGVTVDYAFSDNWYLMSGLDFTNKGAKVEVKNSTYNYNYKVSYSANYLQLPMHVGYKFPIIGETNLVLHAGPYVAYGVSGNIKINGTKSDLFNDTYLKRFDAGLGCGAGLEHTHFAMGFGVDFGLVNISQSNTNIKNMNAYLTVGYKF